MEPVARLRERRTEIEQEILTRAYSISDPAGSDDAEYVTGLRGAVEAAVDFGLDAIESGADARVPIPPTLFSQARHAVREKVGLDTVMRRYFAGYMVFGDCLIEVLEDERPAELRNALRSLAAHTDRVVTGVAEEYKDELEGRSRNAEQRRTARVEKLLAGELTDVADLEYAFDAWHVGAVATGPGSRMVLRDLASRLDCQLLMVGAAVGLVWAWLGHGERIDAAEVLRAATKDWSPEVSLALGEAGYGVSGWRLTHRQARAAVPLSLQERPSLVRYADVALLASALADELLAETLHEAYLAPLCQGRDGGMALRRTLGAYFAVGRNVSSAAAKLGCGRRTVKSRLEQAERRIGRPLESCAAELETALRLAELEPGVGQIRHWDEQNGRSAGGR